MCKYRLLYKFFFYVTVLKEHLNVMYNVNMSYI